MQGKTAIVTGAASGMGRLMAERLAAAGKRVAMIDVNAAALEAPGAWLEPALRLCLRYQRGAGGG